MSAVRITSGGSGFNTDIFVDDMQIKRAVEVSFRIDRDTYPVQVTLTMAPERVVFEGEAEVIIRYMDPITGETFDRPSPKPEDADGST
jgi:asparagine synthetase A